MKTLSEFYLSGPGLSPGRAEHIIGLFMHCSYFRILFSNVYCINDLSSSFRNIKMKCLWSSAPRPFGFRLSSELGKLADFDWKLVHGIFIKRQRDALKCYHNCKYMKYSQRFIPCSIWSNWINRFCIYLKENWPINLINRTNYIIILVIWFGFYIGLE